MPIEDDVRPGHVAALPKAEAKRMASIREKGTVHSATTLKEGL